VTITIDRGISFETQLDEALKVVPDEQTAQIQKAVAEKIARVTEDISRVLTVNGDEVKVVKIDGKRVSPRIEGEIIEYGLIKRKGSFYYPIRFATIGYADEPVPAHTEIYLKKEEN